MRNKKLTIKIWKEKETNLYVASIDHFDGNNYATQGKTMNKLYEMIADLLKLVEEGMFRVKNDRTKTKTK